MPINIHGKQYFTVAERIGAVREDHPDWCINTDLVSSGEMVVVKATVSDETGRQIGSGYAEEERGSTNINKTSAVENCETSAIGRALASCGYAGTEYTSANELSDALINQEVKASIDRYIKLGKAVQDNIASIFAIKQYMADGHLESAVEAFSELTDDDKHALNIAPTKGGIWTVEEYKTFKSNEWSSARKSYYGESA